MHVLMLCHSAVPGGMNDVVRHLLERRPAGVEASWIFLEPGGAFEQSPVPARIVPAGRARELWKVPGVVRELRREIRSTGADVVFSHVTKAHLYGAPAARLEGVPELWWQHERFGQKPVMHSVAGRMRAKAVICSAEHTAAVQRRRFPRTPVVMIPPGSRSERLEAPRRHVATHDVVFGVVGRLQRWKRVDLALEAFAVIRRSLPQARLRVIGDAVPGLDDDYPAELHALARTLGISSAVEFTGHLADGPAAIGSLDVLLHCAEVEPFGLVIVEAMLRGVPVVAPAEGGPLEIVRDGVDGVLLDPTDTGRFAAAAVQLAQDPQRRTRMGTSGRERASAHFTADVMARRAWAVIDAVHRREDPTAAAGAIPG